MSAMTEAYDMPMADFSGDFDIQMQPSTSDLWYQEVETKMEEDGPTLFKIDDSPSKNMAISQDKADGGIEVDMEPVIEEYNTEYEMVDDEHFHAPGDLHDVELHDADVSIELEESHAAPVESLTLTHSVSPLGEGFTVEPTTVENAPLQPSVPHTEVPSIHPENPASALDDTVSAEIPDRIDAPQEAIPPTGPITEFHIAEEAVEPDHPSEHALAPAVSSTSREEAAMLSREAHAPSLPEQQEPTPILPVESVAESTAAPQGTPVEGHVPSESAELDEPHVVNEADATEASSGVDLPKQQWNSESDLPDTPHVGGETLQEAASDIVASTGDPHEISDGVYIDPPPPILLSLGSGDNFDLCLFNNGEDMLHKNQANEHVLLANFPTLYYESLSYIFEALRCEEKVYQAFNLAECELILEAPDLQLTVSEDNIHTRDVTLHDLNILHDVSGLDGLLRIKLSQSSPRFIYRYQRLQEEVNRLHLDTGTDEEYVAETGDGDPSVSNNDQDQDRLTGDHRKGEEAQTTSELHHETQGDSQHDDGQAAYTNESNVTGDETSYDDAHGDFPEDDREHNEDESNSGEDKTSSLPRVSEAGSAKSGLDHSTIDGQVVDENQFELSNDADLAAVHPPSAVGLVAGGEYPADDNVEPGLDDVGDDVDGEGDEYSGFDDVEYDGVDGEEYEAGDGDVKGTSRVDNAPPGSDGEAEAVESTNTSGSAPANNVEDVQSAEDYSLQDLRDGVHDDSTYDPEEISNQQDEYEEEEEEHFVSLQDDEDSTTANTTDDLEQNNLLESAVLEKEVLQHHGDRQAESENLDLAGVASGSSQNLPTDHSSSRNAHDLTEDLHLDPPEHAHDFDDETWEGEFDDDGEYEDDTWDKDGTEKDNENTLSHSNESSVTLSSKASKRSFHEFELDDEGYQDESGIYGTPPSSPGAKRTRTH